MSPQRDREETDADPKLHRKCQGKEEGRGEETLRNRHLGERTGPRRERPTWGPRHRVRAAPQTPCVARGPLGSSIISPPLPSTAQCGSRWWSGVHPCKYHQIPQLGILAMKGFPRGRRCHHQVPPGHSSSTGAIGSTRDQNHHDDVKHRPPTPHSEPCRERRGHVLTPPPGGLLGAHPLGRARALHSEEAKAI